MSEQDKRIAVRMIVGLINALGITGEVFNALSKKRRTA